MKRLLFSLTLSLAAACLHAEDGHRLWLRYDTLKSAKVVCRHHSPTTDIAARELRLFSRSRKVVLKTNPSLPDDEGFTLTRTADGTATLTARRDIGLLYGAYRLLAAEHSAPAGSTAATLPPQHDAPQFRLRLLNHWDNLDGSIERGYAGESIFSWFHLDRQLITEYARANASIGINGSVLNNVNASPKMLTTPYLKEVQTIASILRPYGIRVYLSINFASPMALGDTPTADPLDPAVQAWWQRKAKEIYQLIPDFGGFLVKANSEGQPGPGDYRRSHADGANMLADALQPYGGIVMWRCFVYGANHKGEDRVMQAVSEFKPLDGQFRPNVILQTKNGPLDFQPREPYSPVFDQIRLTPNMAELQITQEYTGQSRHLVYLAPMWQEFFQYVSPDSLSGIAGVANIGLDRNWCGHHFSQANWYAFGRLAWNPRLTSDAIADEWLRLTFSLDSPSSTLHAQLRQLMLQSREACVDYMMPLGLHHIFKFDHHYGPEPDGFKADYPLEWCPVYYHQADTAGIGFDRSDAGTGAVSQYREPYHTLYNNIATCPEELLLWFHHVPWTHRMQSGRTLWEELQARYRRGVSFVEQMAAYWHSEARPYVDAQRWQEVDGRLQQQVTDAREWRDVCLRYFGRFAEPQP
ncbi:MAG: alpha-glucuronidase [Prevotella sp.]|nr:alpha-glucuronidase [Prevotella sp.]